MKYFPLSRKNGSLNKFQRKIQIKICRRKKFLLNVSRSKYLSVTGKLKLFEIRKDPQIILNRAYIIFDKIRKSKIIFRLNSFLCALVTSALLPLLLASCCWLWYLFKFTNVFFQIVLHTYHIYFSVTHSIQNFFLVYIGDQRSASIVAGGG